MSSGWVPSSGNWNNPESAAAMFYPEGDPYFIRPEIGDGLGASFVEGGVGLAANELLGIDDFRRAIGLASQGNWAQAAQSGATGLTELGLTYAAIAGAGPTWGGSLALRMAPVVKAASRAPRIANALRWLKNNPIKTIVGRSGGAALERQGSEPTAEAVEDTAPIRPFVANLPERGGTGIAAVPGLNMSYLQNFMPMSDYQTLLDNELANIEARAAAYGEAVGTEWQRVRQVNEAAVDKALALGDEAGEAGWIAWDTAAQGALDVTNARNEALVQMAGGLPQDIAVGGAVEDFQRFASAAGESERQLQQTLAGNRAEDYRWLAEVADQTAAGYQGSIVRAEQDAAAAAVARHNQAVIARNQRIAEMQFQAAMQQQQLQTQVNMANGAQGGGLEDLISTAVQIRDRNGSGTLLRQLFPDVFPTDADAEGFLASLGTAPIR